MYVYCCHGVYNDDDVDFDDCIMVMFNNEYFIKGCVE